jgi:hypothetical protein
MKRRAVVLIAWVLYSLGYFDHDGRFVLAVTAVPYEDKAVCEDIRDQLRAQGWTVVCAPQDPRER